MSLNIRASVGENGATNNPDDVRIIKQRFKELGFLFFPDNDSIGAGFLFAIRLYQAIITGKNRINKVNRIDGRIDVNGRTHKSLESDIAPEWKQMSIEGEGFTNYEATQNFDTHDFGTNWMNETIIDAGKEYKNSYLSIHRDAALLTINDVSLICGGNTEDHAGHETGLACDIRLPRKDGSSGGIKIANTNSHYDRDAMRAQLIAIRKQPLFRQAYLNDNVLIAERLCKNRKGHSNHAHFEINPPNTKA